MNALALLCNLHGEGPRTLNQLRRAGCESLEDLLDRTVDELVHELELAPEFVARLQREARHLLQRIEGGGLHGAGEDRPLVVEQDADDEEEPLDERTRVAPVLAWDRAASDEAEEAELGDLDEDEDDQEDDDELGFVAGHAQGAIGAAAMAAAEALRAPLQPVLATWRALDESSPPPDPAARRSAEPAATPAVDLEGAGLPGLHRSIAERLSELGIDSLQGLVDAHPLELSRALPLSFTRVKRFQFLAERVLAERDPGQELTPRAPRALQAPSAPPERLVEPSAPPPPRAQEPPRARTEPQRDRAGEGGSDAGPDWVETAGPFA